MQFTVYNLQSWQQGVMPKLQGHMYSKSLRLFKFSRYSWFWKISTTIDSTAYIYFCFVMSQLTVMSDSVRLFFVLREETEEEECPGGVEEAARRPAMGSPPPRPPSGPVEASSPGRRIGWFLVRGLQQHLG